MKAITLLRKTLAMALLALAFTAHAGQQADQALAALKQLISQGEIKPGTVLRLRAKQGNAVSMLGRDFQLQREWESLTGIPIDATVMPQLDSLQVIRGSDEVDITVARNHELAELGALALIEDLTPWLKRLGFELDEGPDRGYMLLKPQAMWGRQVVAIPADFDAALLFLRKDLMDDPAQRARFKQTHGRELALPRTWQEYQQLVEFFSRVDEGFFGAAEPREVETAWMYWLPRYLSAAVPNQWLFDDKMRPLINSPAGIAATESYVATVPYSPPQILQEGKDYSYTLPFFLRGNAFSTVLTAATAKIANREESAVKGKFIAVPMPGHWVGGKLHHRTQFIYGNNLVVPRSSPNKALALLFALWLTDPDNSIRSVLANGLADPYRLHHLAHEQVRAVYTGQALDVLRSELPYIAPSGTGLPGDHDYLVALSKNLWLAAAGKQSAKAAMANTAQAWEAITERLGRASQIAHWLAAKANYPSTAPTRP
ncbi:MAG: extracellular solute-binding protein [Rhodoferax sp.]